MRSASGGQSRSASKPKYIPHNLLISGPFLSQTGGFGWRLLFLPGSRQDSGVQKIPVISIVDDNEAVREATKGLVRSLGYDASTFASAREFLASGQVHDTSCLITDLHMPELSGTDLQSRLIADGHRMPIIFITAYPEDSARERAMKAGAIAFIGKPFSEDRLIGCLERALKTGTAGPGEC